MIAVLLSGCNAYNTFYSATYVDQVPSAKIERLDLSAPRATSDIDFNALRDLRMLNLSGQTSLNLDSVLSALPQPHKLRVLILDSLQLQQLPPVVSAFTHLNQLSLDHNPDLDLPASLLQLAALPLHFLNLQHNQLRAVPVEISMVKSLRDVNLSHNTLLPTADLSPLAQLPDLHSLWIQHNELSQLPQNLGSLVQLQKLYLEHNQLAQLPEELIQLEKLMVLHAGHNTFTKLPPVLTRMPFLFLLHIANCEIATIPGEYQTTDFSIKGLIMPHNKLSEEDRAFWKKEFRSFFALAL